MAYFDKSITFKSFEGESSHGSSSYRFRIYQTSDDDKMQMIEICDESNLKFLFRIRLTTSNLDKLRNHNKLTTENNQIVPFIEQFIANLSSTKYLQCSKDSNRLVIQLCEVQPMLGGRCVFELPLSSVSDEEFLAYVISSCDKYKKRWMDKKIECDEQTKKIVDYKKKMQSYEAKNGTLKKEVEEKNDLKKKLKELQEKYDELEFDCKRALADAEDKGQEYVDLKYEFDDLEDDFNRANKIRLEHAKAIEDFKEEIEELKAESVKLNNGIRIVVEKARKYESTIFTQNKEIKNLSKELSDLEKALKKSKESIAKLQEDNGTKDGLNQCLAQEVETLRRQLELKEKEIEAMKEMQKSKPLSENILPTFPRYNTRPPTNRTLPLFPRR